MQIGTVESRPGELTKGWLAVTELPTGSAERLPVLIAEGTDAGATLWITGSIHGDEVTGLAAAQDVMDHALAERLAGTVVCLPNLNPAGLRRASRTSYYHDDDPNRYFPDPTQKRSRPPRVQEVIDQRLFDCIARTADALVSLHTAGIDSMPFTIVERIRRGERRSESEAREITGAVERLVDAFGLPAVTEFDTDAHEDRRLHRSLEHSVLNVAGIPTFTPELGSHTVVQERNREAAVTGLYNVLYELDMLDGAPEPNEAAPDSPVEYAVKRATHPHTETAGIARHVVNVGDVIDAGDPVADIVTPHGDHKTTVRSEHDGYVLARRSGVAVYENDPLLSMAVEDASDGVLERTSH